MTGSSKVAFENQRRYRMELAINHALREVLHMLWGQVNVKIIKGEVELRGYVQSAKKKEELLLAVRAIADVTHVKDEVIVMPNLSCG